MKSLEKTYLNLLKWGIYISLFLPLVIFWEFLSPFHFGKVVCFRTLVELMFFVFLLLIISYPKYRPKWNPLVWSLFIFTGLFILTSFTGVNIYRSFWGTLERMGGMFTFIHYWIYFIILISVVRSSEEWLKILRLSVFVSLLSCFYAIGQKLDISFFIGHGLLRAFGTVGNPALFAGYLLFNFFLSLMFFFRPETDRAWKCFYGLVAVLEFIILLLTAVRGSIGALIIGLIIFALGYVFLNKETKTKWRWGIIIFLCLIISTGLFLWLNHNASWIQQSPYLRRITDISFKTYTIQTRFWAWHAAWQGWKDRFWLGWGPDNFNIAFNNHFNPLFFQNQGSVTLWDRAHNFIFDIATTMGIFGLLSYLIILFFVFRIIFKILKKNYLYGITLLAIFVSYLIHNSFIFDTFVNYFMFFLILAWLNFLVYTESKIENQNKEKGFEEAAEEPKTKPGIILVFIMLIFLVLTIFKTNIKPAIANYTTTRAIVASWHKQHQRALEKYKEALSYDVPGKMEIRNRFAKYALAFVNYNSVSVEEKKERLQLAIDYMKKNEVENPLDYLPKLFLGRLYTILGHLTNNTEDYDKSIKVLQSALKFCPTNQRLYFEIGQAELLKKDYDNAIKAFEQAVELNPNISLPYWYLGVAYSESGEVEKGLQIINKAVAKGYNYHNVDDLLRLVGIYLKIKDYDEIIKLYQEAIRLKPNDAQLYASLAVAYKEMGDYNKAFAAAKKAGEIDPSFQKEAEEFIKQLPFYKK